MKTTLPEELRLRAQEYRDASREPGIDERQAAAHRGKASGYDEAATTLESRESKRLNRMADAYQLHMVAPRSDAAPDAPHGSVSVTCECGWQVWGRNVLDCAWEHAKHAAQQIGMEAMK